MRYFHCAVLCSLLVLFFHAESFAGKVKFSALERKLIIMADERRNADSLAMFLADKDANVAYRAAIGIANIEDTSVRPQLIARLAKEGRPNVLDAIAFALGVLGENNEAYKALIKVSATSPTDDVCAAIGRTVSKNDLPALAVFMQKSLDSRKISTQSLARIPMEIALRKMMTSECAEFANTLMQVNDPVTNWRATYSFARTEDSSIVNAHIGSLKSMLSDLGSAEVRMFAATALGRIHNDSSIRILLNAARSEQEWRVRVNILNALGKSPRMTSNIFDVIKRTVNESDVSVPTTTHIGLTALTILDNFIVAGKMSTSDSATVGAWLDEYRLSLELHQSVHNLVRSQALLDYTRIGNPTETQQGIIDMMYVRDKALDDILWQGYGRNKDTTTFHILVSRILQSYPSGMLPPLQALNAQWQIAKKDTAYRSMLEYKRLAASYRHMLIRLPNSFTDIAIVTTALANMQDTSIVTDSLKQEANEYLLLYLDAYADEKTHDQLSSVLSTIKWFKPTDTKFVTKLNALYERAATKWGAKDIADSVREILAIIGSPIKTPLKVITKRTIVDWDLLEQSQDTLLVPLAPDGVFIKLDKYNAPLTCLNMIKLAKINFFANNEWHRVVPNFVVQAGDPTGTGEGGPGYSIRREISPREYDSPYVVGMASSGKDTEGSQWFATHLPTPHLNTRYTIWGEITHGGEAIDRIQHGEKMSNILPFSQ